MQTPNDYQLFELSLLLKGISHKHKTFVLFFPFCISYNANSFCFWTAVWYLIGEFKRYNHCLNGKEVVDYICNVDLVDDRTDAITIGKREEEAFFLGKKNLVWGDKKQKKTKQKTQPCKNYLLIKKTKELPLLASSQREIFSHCCIISESTLDK